MNDFLIKVLQPPNIALFMCFLFISVFSSENYSITERLEESCLRFGRMDAESGRIHPSLYKNARILPSS